MGQGLKQTISAEEDQTDIDHCVGDCSFRGPFEPAVHEVRVQVAQTEKNDGDYNASNRPTDAASEKADPTCITPNSGADDGAEAQSYESK